MSASRLPEDVHPQKTTTWQACLMVLAVFACYLPAVNGSFVWDDDAWTTGIIGLLQGLGGLRAMWLHPGALQQYYPLSGTTFWIDYQLWNFWTLPYHVENILLHAGAALLFWRLLVQLRVPGAWLAGMFFALHPVCVESVAWITERKNVLSLVCYLGALLAYGRHVRWQPDKKQNVTPDALRLGNISISFYQLALTLFICALLAKTTTFSLPAAILLIVWWQRGRIRWQEDVRPVLPFFALAIGFCSVTFFLEKYLVGAKGAEFDLTLAQRTLVAGHNFWFYLGKLFYPANLSFVYPAWQPTPSSLAQWLYPLSALALFAALWLAREKIGRALLTAMLFYVGTLFPVLGFMNAYGMRYSLVWDHWVYLSTLGIFALLSAVIVQIFGRMRTPSALYATIAVILTCLGAMTWRQAGIFKDMETLWQKTLAQNPDCALAHNNLGTLLYVRDDKAEGIRHYKKATQIKPDYYEAYYNLGRALADQGDLDEAVANYRQAVTLYPTFPDALNSLGNACVAQGKNIEAVQHLNEAIRLRPYFAAACYNLGHAYLKLGQTDRAVEFLGKSALFDPAYQSEYARLYEMISTDRYAWDLATKSNSTSIDAAQAVTLAQDLCERTQYLQPLFVGTLAGAYASADRFTEAIATARQAGVLAATNGAAALIKKNEELLRLYQTHTAYHERAAK